MPTGTIEGINFFHLPGHPHNTMCLEEAGVAEADAIIIGPADDLNAKEVTLISLFLLFISFSLALCVISISIVCYFIASRALATSTKVFIDIDA